MWDVLDLTSLGLSQASNILGMGSFPDNNYMPEDDNDTSKSSSDGDLDDQETTTLGHVPNETPTLAGDVNTLSNDTPGPDWPFSRTGNNAVASGVPDIPDWMIFGDLMTDHL